MALDFHTVLYLAPHMVYWELLVVIFGHRTRSRPWTQPGIVKNNNKYMKTTKYNKARSYTFSAVCPDVLGKV